MLLTFPLTACAPRPGCSGAADCTRVLFVGNSYTFVNDLPTVFATLAASGGHDVDTGMDAQGGETLAQHAQDGNGLSQIDGGHWTYVVLQEQSEIPAIPSSRDASMYPAVRTLAARVRGAGAQPLLFLTWGHKAGEPDLGLRDFSAMQDALDDGYKRVAADQHTPIAPVGEAWFRLTQDEPGAALWQDDGSHPTAEGTYLAACVFYATIFHASPKGLTYHGDLSDDEAARVQQVAADTVLTDPARWSPA